MQGHKFCCCSTSTHGSAEKHPGCLNSVPNRTGIPEMFQHIGPEYPWRDMPCIPRWNDFERNMQLLSEKDMQLSWLWNENKKLKDELQRSERMVNLLEMNLKHNADKDSKNPCRPEDSQTKVQDDVLQLQNDFKKLLKEHQDLKEEVKELDFIAVKFLKKPQLKSNTEKEETVPEETIENTPEELPFSPPGTSQQEFKNQREKNPQQLSGPAPKKLGDVIPIEKSKSFCYKEGYNYQDIDDIGLILPLPPANVRISNKRVQPKRPTLW